MTIHRLDLDVAIYRDRVQITHRDTQAFADQTAKHGFSSDASIVAHPHYLEDTIVRAIRKILSVGGFVMRQSTAYVVSCETPLDAQERAVVERALAEAGMRRIVFQID